MIFSQYLKHSKQSSVKMGCLDSFVSTGKKFLPPPGVLFITHLVSSSIYLLMLTTFAKIYDY